MLGAFSDRDRDLLPLRSTKSPSSRHVTWTTRESSNKVDGTVAAVHGDMTQPPGSSEELAIPESGVTAGDRGSQAFGQLPKYATLNLQQRLL